MCFLDKVPFIVTSMCFRLVIIHYKMQLVIFACMFHFTSFGTHIYLCCVIKYSLKVGFFPLSFSLKISFELNICSTTLLTKCICSKIPKKMKIKTFLNLCKQFFFHFLGKGSQCILSFMISHHTMVL